MATNNIPKKFSEYFEELKKKQQKIQSIKAQINNLNGDIPKFSDISSEINDVENIEKIKVKLQELKDKIKSNPKYIEEIELEKNIYSVSEDEFIEKIKLVVKNKNEILNVKSDLDSGKKIDELKLSDELKMIVEFLEIEKNTLKDLNNSFKAFEIRINISDKSKQIPGYIDQINNQINMYYEFELNIEPLDELNKKYNRYDEAILLKKDIDGVKNINDLSDDEKNLLNEFDLKNKSDITLLEEQKRLYEAINLLKKIKYSNRINKEYDVESKELKDLKEELKKAEESLKVKEKLINDETLNPDELNIKVEEDLENKEKIEIVSSIEDLKVAIEIKENSDYFKNLEEEKANYPEFELNKNSKEIELDNKINKNEKWLSDTYDEISKKYKVKVNNIDDLKNLISEKLQKLKDENEKLNLDLIEVEEELEDLREILNAHPLMKEVRFENDIKYFEKSIKKSNDNIKELKKLLYDKILKFKNYGQFNDIKDLANKVENGYGLIKDDQEYNELFEKINEFNNEIIRIDQELKDSNLSKVQKDNLEGEKKGIQNNFCKYSRKWIKYLKTYIKREIEILPKVALNYKNAIEIRKEKLSGLTNKKSDDQPNKDPNADDADKDKDKDEDKGKETSGYKLPIKKKEPGFWSKMFSGIKDKWKKRKENKLEKKKAKEKSKGKDEDKDKDKEQKLDDNSLLNNKIDDSNSNVKFENEDKPLTKDYMKSIFSNINEEGSEYNPKYLEQYKRKVEILRQKQIKEEEKEKAEQGRSI